MTLGTCILYCAAPFRGLGAIVSSRYNGTRVSFWLQPRYFNHLFARDWHALMCAWSCQVDAKDLSNHQATCQATTSPIARRFSKAISRGPSKSFALGFLCVKCRILCFWRCSCVCNWFVTRIVVLRASVLCIDAIGIQPFFGWFWQKISWLIAYLHAQSFLHVASLHVRAHTLTALVEASASRSTREAHADLVEDETRGKRYHVWTFLVQWAASNKHLFHQTNQPGMVKRKLISSTVNLHCLWRKRWCGLFGWLACGVPCGRALPASVPCLEDMRPCPLHRVHLFFSEQPLEGENYPRGALAALGHPRAYTLNYWGSYTGTPLGFARQGLEWANPHSRLSFHNDFKPLRLIMTWLMKLADQLPWLMKFTSPQAKVNVILGSCLFVSFRMRSYPYPVHDPPWPILRASGTLCLFGNLSILQGSCCCVKCSWVSFTPTKCNPWFTSTNWGSKMVSWILSSVGSACQTHPRAWTCIASCPVKLMLDWALGADITLCLHHPELPC